MTNSDYFSPDWTSHPGETISDLLSEKCLTVEDFANKLGISVAHAIKIINGDMPINNSLAKELNTNLGGSTDFWMNRENEYQELKKQIAIDWLKCIPLNNLVKLGWLKKADANLEGCLRFFNVTSIQEWKNRHYELISNTSFRISKYENINVNVAALSAWLNQGEILASKVQTNKWDKEKLVNSLQSIKVLSKERLLNKFFNDLSKICSDCGITLIALKAPAGCPVSGATKLLPNGKPLLLISFRYLSDDQFWFTFFHELGHIILHGNTLNIELNDPRSQNDDKEFEANQFAEQHLISEEFRKEMMSMKIDKFSIVRIANRAGVSPGVIVGQMQYMGLIKYNYFNQLKRRYSWDDIDFLSSY